MVRDVWTKWCFVIEQHSSAALTEIRLSVIKSGMDLLGAYTPLVLARGVQGEGGVAIFHDKAKNIRDKMGYSNLSNNMIISELRTTITIQIQC